jgi:hypothetical protein
MTDPLHKNQAGQPSVNGGHFAAKVNDGDEVELAAANDWRQGGSSSEDEFDSKYDAVSWDDGDPLWLDDQLAEKNIPENRIWSVMEGDDGGAVVLTGRHFVNIVGFVVTEEPWEDERESYVWWEAKDDGDFDEDDETP